jgi:hypothetical protein
VGRDTDDEYRSIKDETENDATNVLINNTLYIIIIKKE